MSTPSDTTTTKTRGPRPVRRDEFAERLWSKLADLRDERGISRTWAAKRLGVQPVTLKRWEEEGISNLDLAFTYAKRVLRLDVAILPSGVIWAAEGTMAYQILLDNYGANGRPHLSRSANDAIPPPVVRNFHGTPGRRGDEML